MTGAAGSSRGRLLRWTGSLMLLGLVGKILGLGVQVLTARYLGVDPSLDAYVVAQSLPEMLVQVFMLGALAQLLVPALAGQAHDRGEEEAARFSGRVLGLMVLASGAITLAAGLLAGPLIRVMAPGFDAARHDLAVRLFRLLLVNLPLGALIYFGKALLQFRRRFELAAASAVVASLVQVVAVVLLAPRHGVSGLAAATIGLNLATVLVLSVGLATLPAWVVPRAPRFDPATRKLLRLTLVVGTFSLVSVLSFATDRWFASLLPAGSVAALAYAWRFEPIFLVVIAGAAATPVYTDLSEAAARGDTEVFRAALQRGFKLVALVVGPAAALLAGLSRPLITLLLQRGAFAAADARLVADVLAVLAVAFACWSIGALMVQALNARQQPRLSLLIGVLSTLLNFGFDALFYRPFGVLGLALATTAVALPMTALFTTLVLNRVGVGWPAPLRGFLGAVFLASAAAGAAAWGTQQALVTLPPLARLVAGGAAGGTVLALGALALRPPELTALLRRVRR